MAITSSTWDPAQYLKFSDERLRPALDLMGRIPLEHAGRVVDLGCGTGSMTVLLKQRFADADVLGVDGAGTMLAKAREAAPNCRFEQGDFATWTPSSPPDLIFSNAALHWAAGHETLFPRLLSLLAPHGVLAVQMPSMHDAPLRELQNEVARHGPWSVHLGEAGYARGLLPVAISGQTPVGSDRGFSGGVFRRATAALSAPPRWNDSAAVQATFPGRAHIIAWKLRPR
jgi:trans-aconitate 2-methyltransferase